jgi:hypothetical protein
MPAVVNRSQRGFDQLPALFVLECAAHGRSNEGTPTTPAHAPVELGYEVVLERNVYSHAHTLAHCLPEVFDALVVVVGTGLERARQLEVAVGFRVAAQLLQGAAERVVRVVIGRR